MIATPTELPEVFVLEPEVFSDDRGFFLETFNVLRLGALVGDVPPSVQDNHSRSRRNVLRGLHHQIQQAPAGPADRQSLMWLGQTELGEEDV